MTTRDELRASEMIERVADALHELASGDLNHSDCKYFARAAIEAMPQYEEIEAAARLALEHILELEDAWSRGAIEERDGLGGIRSNRNVEVRVALERALSPEPR